jgi:hypothetical protein
MTETELEVWMDLKGVSEGERPQFREFANHSESCYTENGRYLKNLIDKEDLLSVLMRMERYLVDSNLPGLVGEAKKSGNRNKAFILGQTFTDERENLKDTLFGPKADNSNNNLFTFGYIGRNKIQHLPTPCLVIHRLDVYYRAMMDETRLKAASRSPARRTKQDTDFIEREQDHFDYVSDFKNHILSDILHWPDVTSLPPVEFTERKKARLIQIIRSKASGCFSHYWNAVEVSSLCYATLVLEPDGVGKKTCEEFIFRDEAGNPKRNVFGDTRLIQNALWLNAHILSNDGAVKRMVEYLGLPNITVKETV